MEAERRITELGLEFPSPPKPVAAYVPGVRFGPLIFTSGQLPVRDGKVIFCGKVGADLDTEQGYAAARLCALNALAVIRSMTGDLDRLEQVVKLTGFVNSAPGFTAQPAVLNGASELLVSIFGDRGRHARSAVAANELPLGAAVELELVVAVKEG